MSDRPRKPGGPAHDWWPPPSAPEATAPAGRDESANESTAFSPFADTAVHRRTALKLMSLAAALALPGCEPPREEIVPYADTPEGLVPGNPRHYATALPLLGYAHPAVAECYDGRPTKIEGNGRHPANAGTSTGASDAFAQAAILSLYDPERAETPTRRGALRSWTALGDALAARRRAWDETGGRGLRILTQSVSSPTLAGQIDALLRRWPEARRHCWEPINRDAARRGAEIAYGRPLDTVFHLDRAAVVVTLGADLLGPGPEQVRHARGFAAARRARAGASDFARFYAIESTMSLTGAKADHRLPLDPAEIEDFARALATALGADGIAPPLSSAAQTLRDAIVEDLRGHTGACLVVAGRGQPPEVHALAHWINHRLGAPGRTVDLVAPVTAEPHIHEDSIKALAADMAAGAVGDCIVLGGNPAYDAPADTGFADLLARVPFSIHASAWANETSALCTWHAPGSHPLESWSDAATPEGTAGIVQPAIRPLRDSRSVHEFVAMAMGALDPSGHDIVRAHWRAAHGPADFDAWWRTALQDGFIRGSGATPVEAGAPNLPAAAREGRAGAADGGFTLVFEPDAALWDGRFAENAWLQELPRPFSKLVWGNAAGMSPADADSLGLGQGDVVRIRAVDADIVIPITIAPGQANGVVALPLGYGRRSAGPIGTGIGTDVYPLRPTGALWHHGNVRVEATGDRADLAATQHHHDMGERDIVRTTTAATLRQAGSKTPEEKPHPSLHPDWPYDGPYDGHAWGMVIDQSACIGCNACVSACQAENNVPVVGPEEIRRGRDMHWLRIDTYYRGPKDAPEAMFQAVPCMHCEKAPCEPVCPVAASVHDSEGLNAQVYNRCIGTRFCQANCPYKVRRFNFHGYGNGQEYANLGNRLYHLLHNPGVSVRSRGVMEKCTYCVQRISRARRNASKGDRPIRDGEVMTACQAACPTGAIHFGDLNDDASQVAKLRREPHEYALLGHLGTQPRTTYLARARHPNPKIEDEP